MSDYSIYPKAVDGYAQIPLAVDKQSPVNAESVNRLRSGVINIESTLGVAPNHSDIFGDFDAVGDRLTHLEEDHFAVKEAVDKLEDVTLDSAYINGRVMTLDSGPIVMGGAEFFRFSQEDGTLLGSIDSGSSLNISTNNNDLVLSSGFIDNPDDWGTNIVLKPSSRSDGGPLPPGTVLIDSDSFSTDDPDSDAKIFLGFGGSDLLGCDVLFYKVKPTAGEPYDAGIAVGSPLLEDDPTVEPVGFEISVTDRIMDNTEGGSIKLRAGHGTGTETGGKISLRAGAAGVDTAAGNYPDTFTSPGSELIVDSEGVKVSDGILDLNGNDITSVGLVDGVDVSDLNTTVSDLNTTVSQLSLNTLPANADDDVDFAGQNITNVGSLSAGGSLVLPIYEHVSTGPGNKDLEVDDGYYTILVNAGVVMTTVRLPDATTCEGRIYNIKRIDSHSISRVMDIEMDPADPSINRIDGQQGKSLLNQYDALTVQSDGANWFII
jgi:hypothetical protein